MSGFTESRYCQAVEKVRQYIQDGDAFQVVLSQRLSAPFQGRALDVYRALRVMNPSPYMYHLDFGGFQVTGSSPEVLVRVEDGEVTLRPIAGTRPRGATPEEDQRLAEELLADPKERAEHVMLIDLGRNDVGRVSQTGSVRLSDRMVIERYSHVMHIVSEVKGRLREGLGALDVLKACFPAGTVSGAPKLRALEIIRELEPTRRGIYSGAVGYLGWNGNLDTAIAIRTAVIKDGRIHVQAGAGIVHDSSPKNEWQETLNKARALMRAVQMTAPSGGRGD
jgi:anthranilate synthase component 1